MPYPRIFFYLFDVTYLELPVTAALSLGNT